MTTTRGVLQATRAGISALAAFSQIVTGPGVSRAVLADDLRALTGTGPARPCARYTGSVPGSTAEPGHLARACWPGPAGRWRCSPRPPAAARPQPRPGRWGNTAAAHAATAQDGRPPVGKIVWALLRAAGSTIVLVAVYYLLPLDHSARWAAITILVIGLVLLIALITVQVRSIIAAPFTQVRPTDAVRRSWLPRPWPGTSPR